MTDHEKLSLACNIAIKKKYDNDDKFKTRLDFELNLIEKLNKSSYFLNLFISNKKFAYNENNLLVCKLLGLVQDFNIDQPVESVMTDLPDCDIDLGSGLLQKYIKDDWAPRVFGYDCVANIGNYNTFKLKMAIQDVARVYELDHQEVVAVTKQIPDKDNDGKLISWETALSISSDFREFCLANPEVAEVAKRLVGRNRSRGKHAGGLIISSKSLSDFVPLVLDTEGRPITAWSEGQNAQDLGPIGLVKIDILVLVSLEQIGRAVHLIKKRHGLSSINALPGQRDWTDETYLNDKKSLDLACRGLLKGIFQFEKTDISRLTKEAKPERFEDMVAITALYRPGSLMCVFADTDIDTPNGKIKIKNLDREPVAYLDKFGVKKYTDKYIKNGPQKKKLLKIKLKSGRFLIASEDHMILTRDGYKDIKKIKLGTEVVVV